VIVPDVSAYERFLVEHLRRLPGLLRIKSGFALRPVKHSGVPPLAAGAQTGRRPARPQRPKAHRRLPR
jgi:hypothetical protein